MIAPDGRETGRYSVRVRFSWSEDGDEGKDEGKGSEDEDGEAADGKERHRRKSKSTGAKSGNGPCAFGACAATSSVMTRRRDLLPSLLPSCLPALDLAGFRAKPHRQSKSSVVICA